MSAADLDKLSREELIALLLGPSPVVIALQERVAALEEENRQLRAQLSGGSGTPKPAREVPSFVKPNRPPRSEQGPPKERKKRQKPAFRAREEPTEVREHRLATCPECGHTLSEGWLARSRQVIELPEVPVQVIEHRMFGHHCGVCQRNFVARADLSEEALGQHRVGVGLMSLIAVLREEARLPVRAIPRLLAAQYGLKLSAGEVVEALHAVAARGSEAYAQLKQAVRASEVVHADETGWREDGENGYLWSFSNEQVCYLERHASRGSEVAKQVLGEAPTHGPHTHRPEEQPSRTQTDQTADAFGGVLCSDFYSAYSWYLGEHQRCWAHLLRDVHALQEAHPSEPSVQAWSEALKKIYAEAREWVAEQQGKASEQERRQQRFAYQAQVEALGQPYAKVAGVPQSVLADRLLRFAPELFVFVEYPSVPSENNAAERCLRPSVIARKISGGTRSQKGSRTRCVLRSLFGTWRAQGKDLLATCRQMLAGTLQPAPT